ncbi:hypothetical protein POVCU2_0080680 [Plasmodium ovale curtisi]|uniref:Uncharacterized protein n=1 Tax=Plasmodium ovale curtisi TaxID=864141 RepID=A0A1A8WK80_PLAOA|nr:hypothetical protein POVCU1_005610 [Plasmodium ovale curtisi]SBS93371.1 hypothetical protein POVCU2_0080680 [Plasmodium ovale curtisi]
MHAHRWYDKLVNRIVEKLDDLNISLVEHRLRAPDQLTVLRNQIPQAQLSVHIWMHLSRVNLTSNTHDAITFCEYPQMYWKNKAF